MTDFSEHGYETPKFSLAGRVQRARVVDIYDGDSVQVTLEMSPGGDVRRFALRLLGIDTPEIRNKCPDGKRRALAARDRLASLVTGEPMERFAGTSRAALRAILAQRPAVVEVRCEGYGKYGRVLAELYDDRRRVGGGASDDGGRVSFAESLIAEGYGTPYSGGRR